MVEIRKKKYLIPGRGYTKKVREAAIKILFYLSENNSSQVKIIYDDIISEGTSPKTLMRAKALLRRDGFIENYTEILPREKRKNGVAYIWYVKLGKNIAELENIYT